MTSSERSSTTVKLAEGLKLVNCTVAVDDSRARCPRPLACEYIHRPHERHQPLSVRTFTPVT